MLVTVLCVCGVTAVEQCDSIVNTSQCQDAITCVCPCTTTLACTHSDAYAVQCSNYIMLYVMRFTTTRLCTVL